jgi:hypothetical protein
MRRLLQNILIWLALAVMGKDFVQQTGLPLIPSLIIAGIGTIGLASYAFVRKGEL